MKRKKQTSEKETVLTTEKKLRNVRTCLYVLILAAITKIAMTDFYEVSYPVAQRDHHVFDHLPCSCRGKRFTQETEGRERKRRGNMGITRLIFSGR